MVTAGVVWPEKGVAREIDLCDKGRVAGMRDLDVDMRGPEPTGADAVAPGFYGAELVVAGFVCHQLPPQPVTIVLVVISAPCVGLPHLDKGFRDGR